MKAQFKNALVSISILSQAVLQAGCADVGDSDGLDAQKAQQASAQSQAEPSASVSVPLDEILYGDAPVAEASEEGVDKGAAQWYETMTVNVRAPNDGGERDWNVRKYYLRDMIQRYAGGPHVLAVQETYQRTLNDLSALMPQYWWYTVDRGDGGMNTIMVRTDRFEILDFNFRNTTNSERDDLCTIRDDEDPLNRPIMWVRMRDRLTGRIQIVYNTHYPSKNSCERKQMSKIVRDYINSRADKTADVVLMGDLNDGVNGDGTLNDSYSRLLSYTGFRNAYGDVFPFGPNSEYTTVNDWNKTLRHGKMIDHVLVSGGLAVLGAGTDKTMFTSAGGIVDCATVTNGRCPNGMLANDLRLYSDHWASLALLYAR